VILLRLVSWPYARRHLARVLLTAVGVMLGVAVFIGMHAANRAVLDGLAATVDRVAGRTQLQVTAGDGGFPEAVLERVQALPEVRAAAPVIEAPVETDLPGQGTLLVLGVDMTGDRSLREYDFESGEEAIVDDPLVFLAQPDSLIVTRTFAAKHRLSPGSRLVLRTLEGDRTFTVRGVMKTSGLANAFGGDLAVMDIYAAQRMFGRGRTFDRIDVGLAEGVSLEAGRAAIARALGPGFEVEPPSSRGGQYEAVLEVYAVSMTISSLFALFIGMFIIYNAFAIAVAERRTEIGILRALGATRGQISRLFLVESAALGLVGAIGGCAAGVAIARGIVGPVSGMLEGVFGYAQQPEPIALSWNLAAIAVAAGFLTSVVAAVVPAHHAARVDPVQALQKGKYQVLTAGENRARRRVAWVLAAAAAACLALGDARPAFYAGYALAIGAALLLTPTLALGLAALARPLLRWIRPVEGTLAADSLIQAPRRTSGTVAALMLSVAQVIGLGGMARASYRDILDWVTTALNPDLFVTPTGSLSARAIRFPASLADEIAAVEGVDTIQRVRSMRIRYGGGPVLLIAIELDSLGRRAPRTPVAGDAQEMYRRAAAGEGCIVSHNFAELQRVRLGDVVELGAPGVRLRLPVVGIVKDWSDQLGTILIDRRVFVRAWGDDSVNVFRVYVRPGEDPAAVRARLLERVGRRGRLFVLMNHEVRAWILGLTHQWFDLTYAQIAVAVLVAVLGIANTLTVSILDRRRELAVLQAVGGLRRQVRGTIWTEAVATSAIGLALGFALGAANLWFVLRVARDIGGQHLAYQYPAAIALGMIPALLAAAFLSALGPGEAAVRGSLVEGLAYE
jgi:putative ABC transport system permease protein